MQGLGKVSEILHIIPQILTRSARFADHVLVIARLFLDPFDPFSVLVLEFTAEDKTADVEYWVAVL